MPVTGCRRAQDHISEDIVPQSLGERGEGVSVWRPDLERAAEGGRGGGAGLTVPTWVLWRACWDCVRVSETGAGPSWGGKLDLGGSLGMSWEAEVNKASSSFAGGAVVKNPPAKAGDAGSIPESGRSPEGGSDTQSCVLAWKFDGQRRLEDCSPWGHKSWTEQLGMQER